MSLYGEKIVMTIKHKQLKQLLIKIALPIVLLGPCVADKEITARWFDWSIVETRMVTGTSPG